jgi:hypothetical protein
VTLEADFGAFHAVDLVAMLCTNATPHANLLAQSADLSDTGVWTRTNLDNVTRTGGLALDSGEIAAVWSFASDGGAGEHKLTQRFSRLGHIGTSNDAQSYAPFTFSIWLRAGASGSSHLRVAIVNDPDSVPRELSVDVDVADGTVEATTAGSYTGVSAAFTDSKVSGGATYRLLVVTATPPTGSGLTQDYDLELAILDGTFTLSHSSTEVVRVAAPMFDPATSEARAWAPSSDPTGSMWQVGALVASAASYATPRALPLRSDLTGWHQSAGWIHSYAVLDPLETIAAETIALEIHDPDNEDGYLDISNIYIGPSFQPTRNFASDYQMLPNVSEPLVSRAAGGQQYRGSIGAVRRWRLRFGYQNQADTYEFHAMRHLAGSVLPVLAILDPEESVYGQEQVLYGWIEDLRIEGKGLFTPDDGGPMVPLHQVEITMMEAIP